MAEGTTGSPGSPNPMCLRWGAFLRGGPFNRPPKAYSLVRFTGDIKQWDWDADVGLSDDDWIMMHYTGTIPTDGGTRKVNDIVEARVAHIRVQDDQFRTVEYVSLWFPTLGPSWIKWRWRQDFGRSCYHRLFRADSGTGDPPDAPPPVDGGKF